MIFATCCCGHLVHENCDMIEKNQFPSVPERQTPSLTSNNNNNAGTKMNPIVTPIIGDTNNVNYHPILSDTQSAPTPTTWSIQEDSSTSNTMGTIRMQNNTQRFEVNFFESTTNE
ncbi:unnamed protein product [Rotaria sp. Silwood2]|nr:unnamed protein product [Rotaria sp. Silwood2]